MAENILCLLKTEIYTSRNLKLNSKLTGHLCDTRGEEDKPPTGPPHKSANLGRTGKKPAPYSAETMGATLSALGTLKTKCQLRKSAPGNLSCKMKARIKKFPDAN